MRTLLGKLGGGNCRAIPPRRSAFLVDFRRFLRGASQLLPANERHHRP
jgi:hypothetical protein